jgi:hypothetical protein
MTDKPTRRVRGNGEPPPDDPIDFWFPDQPEETDDGTLVDFLIALIIIIASIGVMIYAVGVWA